MFILILVAVAFIGLGIYMWGDDSEGAGETWDVDSEDYVKISFHSDIVSIKKR